MNLVYGKGYNSKGCYKTKINSKNTMEHSVWRGMLRRCYSIDRPKNNAAYIDCSVTEDWLDFQVFAEWYKNQAHSDTGYQLDKDILFPENKIYSPDKCCFVPQEINNALTDRRRSSSNLPPGVCLSGNGSKYRARISVNRKTKTIGVFESPDEAYLAYKVEKEKLIKSVAKKWKGRIDERVFNALMIWELKIY